MDIFFESAIGTAFYRELAEAGSGIDVNGDEKRHLIPKLIITWADESEPAEFFAISHVVENKPHFVWALVCVDGMEPHLAYFDTRIFGIWSEDRGIVPWDELYGCYRYTGDFSLQQLLEASTEAIRQPGESFRRVIDALEMI